jgi:2-alkenal reductase
VSYCGQVENKAIWWCQSFVDEKMKKFFVLPMLFVLVIEAGSLYAQRAGERMTAEPRAVVPRPPLQDSERGLVTLFESAAPSVAYITTESVVQRGFFGAELAQGAGSGFVWDNAGHIVTNNHVVQGTRRVLVQLDAGKKPIAAELVGTAPEYDLAVVRLNTIPGQLKPIPLGSSRDLKIGQSVIAIGNPFGLSRTLTTGIVSALDRHVPTSEYLEIPGAIQTDAAINPGNSGGPLLDSAGRLIGLNTAIRSSSGSSAGVGFAIPVDLINRIVPQLISRGRAALPSVGFRAANPALVAQAGIQGVVVETVYPKTPAAEAGLQAYDRRSRQIVDVVVGVNGKPINTYSDFFIELDRAGIGTVVELTVTRDGRERKVRTRVIDATV